MAPLLAPRSLVRKPHGVFALDAYELNIFETHQTAHRVPLRLEGLALTTMLRGKSDAPARPPGLRLPARRVSGGG
ncbi:MAG: hypothetical protein WKG07_27680 [Hymenobacter sp.]